MERKYKESGIEWIGKIPEEWNVMQLRRIMRNRSERNQPNAMVLSLYRDLGIIPKDSRDDNHNVTSENTANYKAVSKGNFVINKMKAWQGSMAVSEYDGIVSPAYYVCTFTRNVYKRYIHYLLRDASYKPEYLRLSTGMRIGQWDLSIDDFLRIKAVLPSITEQKCIADYLDEKCGEIDSLIGLQEQMIEKLKAYKQSVITEAVTKGLNPNAKLVPSGIDWIGEIHEGWEINKLFNLCSIKGRVGWKGLKSDEFKEDSYAYLVTGQDFVSSDINWKNCYQIDKNRYDEDPFIQLSNGDILVTKDGTIGKIAKVRGMDKPACLNSGIFVLKQRKEAFFQNYLYWYLSSPLLLQYNTFINSGGTTIIHLYQNVFERFSMIVPPMEEQMAIATYLDEKCADIDRLIALKQQKIETLNEYKKSLIYEAVTGKIDLTA